MTKLMKFRWDVFISYSTKDLSVCEHLRADLEKGGLTCWHDLSRVKGGMRIREEINDGLIHSACVLILISIHSIRSRWVLNELDAAMLREIRERRILVVPVLIGRVPEHLIPADLRGKRHFDLRFNFINQYAKQREIIVQTLGLLARRTTHPSRRALMLGSPAMSHMFAKDYKTSPVGRMREEDWQAFTKVFLMPSAWRDQSAADCLARFQSRFGQEGIRKLLMFLFDVKQIDIRHGFGEEQLIAAMVDAKVIVLLTDVAEELMRDGHKGVEIKILPDRQLRYRLIEEPKPAANLR